MELNIKKLSPTPKDEYEAIRFMHEFSQDLVSAIFIMKSVLEFKTEIDIEIEINERRIREFISKYENQ